MTARQYLVRDSQAQKCFYINPEPIQQVAIKFLKDLNLTKSLPTNGYTGLASSLFKIALQDMPFCNDIMALPNPTFVFLSAPLISPLQICRTHVMALCDYMLAEALLKPFLAWNVTRNIQNSYK